MVAKTAVCWFALVNTLTYELHFTRFLPNFIYGLLSSISRKCLNMNDNKYGRKNCYPLFNAGYYAGPFSRIIL